MDKPQKTILISGGAGFIGYNLTRFLLKQGHTIIWIDNFSSGSLNHMTEFMNNTHFYCINGDVCDTSLMKTISKSYDNIDEIYNLACPASPPFYKRDPSHTIFTCVQGIFNMLNIAHEHNSKFLQASTSEVYGDPLETPQNENYHGNVNTYGERACYDEGKRCAESLVWSFNNSPHNKKNTARIVRIFNTYGPGMRLDDGRVLTNFFMNAIKDEPLVIYGDGSQTRSFMYIDDLIRALVSFMDLDTLSNDNIILNIGNPNCETTILELANKIIYMTGSRSHIEFIEKTQDDPHKRCPDISRACEVLGWSPTIDLESGLFKMYIDIQSRLDSNEFAKDL